MSRYWFFTFLFLLLVLAQAFVVRVCGARLWRAMIKCAWSQVYFEHRLLDVKEKNKAHEFAKSKKEDQRRRRN